MRARSRVVAVAGGAVVGGLTVAAAATLGSLTPDTIGASSAVVSACQTSGLGVTWGGVGFDSVGPAETISNGTITGVAVNCRNLPFRVDVADGAGTSLANASGTTAAAATTPFTLSSAVHADAVTQTAVVIYG
ncbi:MAG: hypothetical protein U0R64_04335 [Candidatus Nanopelagicales bacterium]